MKGKLCAPAPAQPRHANIHSTLPPCTERTAQYSDYTCSRWYIRINCYKYSEHNWYEPAKNEIELKTVFRARSFHFNISRSGVFFMNFSAFVLVIRWFGDSVVSYLLLLIFRATNLPKQILFIGHNYIYICIYILRFECFVHRRWQQRRPCVVQRRDSYWKHQNKMFPSPDVISFSAVLVCECFFFSSLYSICRSLLFAQLISSIVCFVFACEKNNAKRTHVISPALALELLDACVRFAFDCKCINKMTSAAKMHHVCPRVLICSSHSFESPDKKKNSKQIIWDEKLHFCCCCNFVKLLLLLKVAPLNSHSISIT